MLLTVLQCPGQERRGCSAPNGSAEVERPQTKEAAGDTADGGGGLGEEAGSLGGGLAVRGLWAGVIGDRPEPVQGVLGRAQGTQDGDWLPETGGGGKYRAGVGLELCPGVAGGGSVADRGLLIKEGRADLMTGAVLMGENLTVGKTGAEFCPPRGSLPGCQVGLGMPWLLLGVRVQGRCCWVGPALWLQSGCGLKTTCHGSGEGVETAGGRASGVWGLHPLYCLLTWRVLGLCLPRCPSHVPSLHSVTWTSPLTWTSRVSCVSCPAPPTTGCAEVAPGFLPPGPAGPVWAQGLWHS